MMWWGNSDPAMSVLMAIALLACLTAAVGVVTWVVYTRDRRAPRPRVTGRTRTPGKTAYDDAEQLLARRLAAGEIDEAQFHRTRAILQRDGDV